MSKPQECSIYIIHIITNQKDRFTRNTVAGVWFERYCPLLVKPTTNNLLIQQRRQTMSPTH